jgi:hypothetical protein
LWDTEGDWPGCDTDSELDDTGTEGDSSGYCADTGTYCLSCWPGTVQHNESRIIIIFFSFGWTEMLDRPLDKHRLLTTH